MKNMEMSEPGESSSNSTKKENSLSNESSKSFCKIVTPYQTKCAGFLIKLLKNDQNCFCFMTIGRLLSKI